MTPLGNYPFISCQAYHNTHCVEGSIYGILKKALRPEKKKKMKASRLGNEESYVIKTLFNKT